MLHHLEWQTLEQRRIATNLTMLYKISNNIVTVPTHTYLTPWTRPATRSHNLCYMSYQCNTNTLKYSFFHAPSFYGIRCHLTPLTCSRTHCLPGRSTPSQQLQSNTAQLIKCTPARLASQLFRAHCCIITCGGSDLVFIIIIM